MKRALLAIALGAVAAGVAALLTRPPPPPEVAPFPSRPAAERESAPDKELPAAEPQGLTKGPWLVRPSKTGVTIMFESDAEAGATVRYGEGEALDKEKRVRPREKVAYPAGYYGQGPKAVRYLFAAELEGLKPGTRYAYHVEVAGAKSGEAFFKTVPEKPEKVTFIAYGDSRSNPDVHEALASRFLAHEPDFILHTGDFVDIGHYAEWGRLVFEPLAGVIDRVSLRPCIGNHEGDGLAYRQLFGVPEGKPLYYSFDHGNAHVVSLDTWTTMDPARQAKMRDWCERDLAASRAPWKVVFGHYPSYNAGGHRSRWGREDFVPLYHRHGVDLVISGHSHMYERFVPMTSKENSKRPVTYVTAAGGGAVLYETRPHPYLAAAKRVHHYAVVTVEGATLTLEAYDDAGERIDRVSWSKAGGVPDAAYRARARPREAFDEAAP